MMESKTVVLRWVVQREWRVAVSGNGIPGMEVARAMEEAVNASGIFHTPGVDPYSVEFQIEDN